MKKSLLLFFISLVSSVAIYANDVLTLAIKTEADGNNRSKTERVYDANGNQTLYANYNWISDKNDWVGSSKYESTYDTNGNKTSIVSYFWLLDISEWSVPSKTEYTYDANGNKTLEVDSYWDSETNEWVVSSKITYIYENTVTAVEEINAVASKPDGIYDLQGHKVSDNATKGIYIVVKDGKAHKVLRK